MLIIVCILYHLKAIGYCCLQWDRFVQTLFFDCLESAKVSKRSWKINIGAITILLKTKVEMGFIKIASSV